MSIELLNYLWGNGYIIGAEYDHPDEYDDKHWASILSGALLDIIKKKE